MCIEYDIKAGVIKDFHKYLVPVFIILISCIEFYSRVKAEVEIGFIDTSVVFSDYILYMFKGSFPYTAIDKNFEMPIIWFLLQIYLAYIIGKYPTESLSMGAINTLTRSKTRIAWWISKCVWNILSCVIYYITIYATIAIFCAVMSIDISFYIQAEYSQNVLLYAVSEDLFVPRFILTIMLIPVFGSISISMVQMTLSFIIKPIYSFMIIAIFLIASIYIDTPLLIGNCSMLARNALFIADGITSEKSIIFLLATAVLFVIVGAVYFEKYDVLKKE